MRTQESRSPGHQRGSPRLSSTYLSVCSELARISGCDGWWRTDCAWLENPWRLNKCMCHTLSILYKPRKFGLSLRLAVEENNAKEARGAQKEGGGN